MIELEQTGFYRIAPLFTELTHSIPLRGVFDAINPARVFIDDYLKPKAAMIWTSWGYHYLGGEPGADFVQSLRSKLRNDLMPLSGLTGDPSLLFTLSPDSQWREILPDLLPRPKPICIYRRTFAFDGERFQATRLGLKPLTPGYQLLPINDLLINELKAEILPTWGSLDAYRERGFGFAVCNDERVVSSCVAAFVANQAVEIGVQTAESYQRRHYGTHTAAALINECLRRRLRPNWECFWDNKASIGLAVKLGFTPQGNYPLYYWAPDLR